MYKGMSWKPVNKVKHISDIKLSALFNAVSTFGSFYLWDPAHE